MRPFGASTQLIAERYRLGDSIGRGGMGVVYRATDEVLGREVAIKLLLPTREGATAIERFRREARAAAMLTDPHVVATYDFGPHGDGHFLAMELVEGRSLSGELKLRGPLAAGRALEIVRQAAAGLAAAHQHGLIHRDIKPANLMLTPNGLVKVADFGIVRILGDTPTTLTATGQIVGTSHYLAPERAQGRPAEAASDVYALGCVLHQLVTGQPPFIADDPVAVMYQHVRADPVPPSELRPELAGEFEALLFWMMAKDPADRPTAAQVAAGATPPPQVDTEVLPVLPVRRRPSRNALVAAGAALVIAGSAAVGLLIDANTTKLPATEDLKPPAPSASTPAVSRPAPSRSATDAPATVAPVTKAPARTAPASTKRTSAKPTTAGPSAPPGEKTKKPKPPKPSKPSKPSKPGRPG
ncbi:protein kinase [Kribbella sp. NPDC056861]|uniref:serine/threonine-protein kinase n=1 Tax=Kribbella sp. NPDC056861 TaxID=3154857 RepID=UPI003436E29B